MTELKSPLAEKKIAIEEKKEEQTKETRGREANLIFAQAQLILREYGQESNIPVPHTYWELMNRFRTLSRPTP